MKICEETPQGENTTKLMDKIIDKYGYSWITWKTFILSFFIISLEGFHFSFVSNMIISLKQYYQMEDADIELINGFFFIAVGIGSLITGYLSKNFKRIRIIITVVFIVAVCHVSLAFSNLVFFALFRLILGMCQGIAVPITINLLTEYLPVRMRSVMITGVWLSYNFGQLINLFLMLFIMPNNEVEHFEETVMCSSILSVVAFMLVAFFLNDSPRNLLANGDTTQAFQILSTLNGKELTESEQLTLIDQAAIGERESNGSFFEIFNPSLLRISILLIILWVINSLLGYGPALIIPLTMKELGIQSEELIVNQIMIGLIYSPSNLIGGFVSEVPFLGRNKTTILAFTFMVLTNFILINDPTNYQIYIGIYLFFSNIAFNVNSTYSCEVYPTRIRDITIGFLFFCTRIGGFISQIIFIEFNKVDMWLPYYVTMVLGVLGVICVSLLPYDTYSRELDKEESKILLTSVE
jgi:AAHS family 4-hydroxybenzoate transporter-like MFS transporter